MNQKKLTWTACGVAVLLILLSVFFVYKYKFENKIEPTSSNRQIESEKNSDNKDELQKNDQLEQNTEEKSENKNDEYNHSGDKDYHIPNVDIKSLNYDEYDKKDKSKKVLDIKLDYLVIENKDNLKSIENLNSYLKKEAEKGLNALKDEFGELYGIPIEQTYGYEEKSTIIKNNKHGIISVSTIGVHEHGGPYPWVLDQSYTLDCLSGKKLNIFDVVKGEKNAILDMIEKETLQELIRIHKDNKEITEDEIKNTMDIGKNDRDWESQAFYLDDKSLVVGFSRGDIGPNAWGAISVNIPYETIKKYNLSVDSRFID